MSTTAAAATAEAAASNWEQQLFLILKKGIYLSKSTLAYAHVASGRFSLVLRRLQQPASTRGLRSRMGLAVAFPNRLFLRGLQRVAA
jgi:hypothetical protein